AHSPITAFHCPDHCLAAGHYTAAKLSHNTVQTAYNPATDSQDVLEHQFPEKHISYRYCSLLQTFPAWYLQFEQKTQALLLSHRAQQGYRMYHRSPIPDPKSLPIPQSLLACTNY